MKIYPSILSDLGLNGLFGWPTSALSWNSRSSHLTQLLLAAAMKKIVAVEQQEVCRPLMGLSFQQMAQFRQA
jgi:hypothetical protein